MIELRRYQLEDESTPVTEWLRNLRDLRARAQIEVRLRRVSAGNFGDCKSVGEGVSAQRLEVASGYWKRLPCVFWKTWASTGHIAVRGDKTSQQPDIARAKTYWADWKRRNS